MVGRAGFCLALPRRAMATTSATAVPFRGGGAHAGLPRYERTGAASRALAAARAGGRSSCPPGGWQTNKSIRISSTVVPSHQILSRDAKSRASVGRCTSCRVVESAQVQRSTLLHERPRFQALVSTGSLHPYASALCSRRREKANGWLLRATPRASTHQDGRDVQPALIGRHYIN